NVDGVVLLKQLQRFIAAAGGQHIPIRMPGQEEPAGCPEHHALIVHHQDSCESPGNFRVMLDSTHVTSRKLPRSPAAQHEMSDNVLETRGLHASDRLSRPKRRRALLEGCG